MHGARDPSLILELPPARGPALLPFLLRIAREGLWVAYWRAGIPRMVSSPMHGRGETVGSTAYEAGPTDPARTMAGDS